MMAKVTPASVRAMVRCADGSVELDVPMEGIRRALGDPSALLWVDIEDGPRNSGGGDREALLRDVFGFHQLTIDDCYNALIDPPKVDNYGDYLFIIIHDVRYDTGARDLSTAELDLYVGPNYVVSFHQRPVRAVDDVRRRAEGRSLVMEHGAGFLAHALMDVVVDDFHPVVAALDEQVADLEEWVLDVPTRSTLQEILVARRVVQQLKRSILPQRDVAARFARGEYAPLIPNEALMYFRDIHDHTMRVEGMIDSIRDLADSALNTYLSSVNNRTNDVMRTLAVVAVIFLPLTLIASVYGTNFEETVPRYDTAWGFWVMLASFVVILIGLGVFFRTRRWW